LEKHHHNLPIHVAARRGYCTVIEELCRHCDTTARDSLGQTAVHVAALEGHIDACQLFVYLAGDQFELFDVVDVLGRTPFYIACSLGNASLARILVSCSDWRVICHERKKSKDGPLYEEAAQQPPLHAAVVNNHVNTVSVLLDCGVDVNQTDMYGRTAISAAAKLGHFEMCKLLIAHGADINQR
jgi:ankyrin repeat protein